MVEILWPGLMTSVQDLGRFKYRRFGVPVSGPMDYQSALMANQILGNDANAPLLEITMVGPVLRFDEACYIAITGACFLVELDGVEIEMGSAIQIAKHQVLTFKSLRAGLRAYLGISGGFIAETKLGSVCQLTAVTSTSCLAKGDLLEFNPISAHLKQSARVRYNAPNFKTSDIEVTYGPEFLGLDEATQKNIFKGMFTLSNQINRMGARLESLVDLQGHEIITGPVLPGTVQLTPSGQLIILGQDAQTTGGYARVLQLTRKGMDQLAQKQPRSSIRFLLLET